MSSSLKLAILAALAVGCSSPDALDGWPAELVTRSPTNQAALIGYSVNDLPAVQLLDPDGKPIVGADITFAVTTGGGSLTGAVATTGSNGTATVGGWAVTPGANALTATIPAPFRVAPVTFTASGVGQAYNIALSYLTTVSPTRQATFDTAAVRWQRLIYGDIPDLNLTQNPIPPDLCFQGQPSIGGIVDDVLIHVILDSIDGPGFILGGATPCFIRTTGKLPLHGVMIFDTADVATLEGMTLFDEVIMHEMGHILGFGTIWGTNLLNVLVGAGGGDPFFSGLNARTAFDRMGGTNYTGGGKVPVENCCGPGTRDSHWRETVFGNELMTGFLNGGVANPLSVLTVASFRDLAYQVNYAAAEPYVHSFSAALTASTSPQAQTIALGDDILRLPIHEVDMRGRLTLVARPR